ncbi:MULTISPECIES: universal stress protein [unclassified Paenibacillus]|uniref:universal stress protein n=1 Tax=unclassified Paenibacillus TaxID=185978 RepID=UPI001F221BD8|nr:universal stress protein [Paenibacillus sp. JJ-223]CAH1222847.1 Putative universal stress protein [Paenibacillus sp. JJ-223]
MLKRILVAVDGSEHARRALEAAADLAESLKEPARLTLLHVNPSVSLNEPALGVDLDARIADEGRQVVDALQERLSKRSVAYETLLTGGDPVAEICRVAGEQAYDLIVMGTGGKKRLSEMIMGSVSHGVLKQAVCPVLTVK